SPGWARNQQSYTETSLGSRLGGTTELVPWATSAGGEPRADTGPVPPAPAPFPRGGGHPAPPAPASRAVTVERADVEGEANRVHAVRPTLPARPSSPWFVWPYKPRLHAPSVHHRHHGPGRPASRRVPPRAGLRRVRDGEGPEQSQGHPAR